MAAAHLLQRGQQVFLGDLELVGELEQEVLGRQVLVAQRLLLGDGRLDEGVERAGQRRVVAAVVLGQLGQLVLGVVAGGERRDPDLLEHGQHHRVGLAQQRGQQVIRRDLGVIARLGAADRLLDRFLGFERPPIRIECHP